MPYIAPDQRPAYDAAVDQIVSQLVGLENEIDADGHLNYVISAIIMRYLKKMGMKYARASRLICGTLSSCQMEMYRRCLADYEDQAIQKNGDVATE